MSGWAHRMYVKNCNKIHGIPSKKITEAKTYQAHRSGPAAGGFIYSNLLVLSGMVDHYISFRMGRIKKIARKCELLRRLAGRVLARLTLIWIPATNMPVNCTVRGTGYVFASSQAQIQTVWGSFLSRGLKNSSMSAYSWPPPLWRLQDIDDMIAILQDLVSCWRASKLLRPCWHTKWCLKCWPSRGPEL